MREYTSKAAHSTLAPATSPHSPSFHPSVERYCSKIFDEGVAHIFMASIKWKRVELKTSLSRHFAELCIACRDSRDFSRNAKIWSYGHREAPIWKHMQGPLDSGREGGANPHLIKSPVMGLSSSRTTTLASLGAEQHKDCKSIITLTG